MKTLEVLPGLFTVCKLSGGTSIPTGCPFLFLGKSDRELSLVCPPDSVPFPTLAREDGWRAFRFAGMLDFSLTGILARCASVLAEAGISIFALSTYDTDYVLIKEEQFSLAISLLRADGYEIFEK